MNVAAEKKAYAVFIKAGMTPAGACGLIGNLEAESDGFFPNRVEYLCIKRMKEAGQKYLTDESYTKAIDEGNISAEQFLHPLPGKQYGYGLAQWTSPGRKAGLYNLAKQKGVSIADLDMQLEFLMTELRTSYSSVFSALKTATSIRSASDIVLKKFEIPANTSESVCAGRAARGQKFYDNYVKKEGTTVATNDNAINAVLAIAESEIGYLEKKSNAQLDSKTANAGSANYTKYWRDLYPQFQAQAWCAIFVTWCMVQAFGQTVAKALLKHYPFTYVPTLAGMTSNTQPKRGDVVCFYRNGTFTHTGFVTAVSGNTIKTIEGNTSGGSTIIANGGGVCAKSYSLSSLKGTRFFRPDYSIVKNGKPVTPAAPTKPSTNAGKYKESGTNAPSEKPKYKLVCTGNAVQVRTHPMVKDGNQSKYLKQLYVGNEVMYCDEITANGYKWYFVRIDCKAHPDGYIYDYVAANYFKRA